MANGTDGTGVEQAERLSDALIRNSNRRQRVRLLVPPLTLVVLLAVAIGFGGEVSRFARLGMISVAGSFVLSLMTWYQARDYPDRIERALADPRSITNALAYPNGFSSCLAFGIAGQRLARFQKVDRATVGRFVATMTEASVPLQVFSGSSEYLKALRGLS